MRFPLAFLLAPLLLGGCAFLPHNDFYQPPPEQPDSAWLRIVGNTVWTDLYVGEGAERHGGLIRKSNFVMPRTVDRNMPRVKGREGDTDGYFFETPLVPGVRVKVGSTYSHEEYGMLCYIPASFVPQARHYYQFTMYVNRYQNCRLVPTEIVRGEDGQWRIIPFNEVTYEHPTHPEDPGLRDMPPSSFERTF